MSFRGKLINGVFWTTSMRWSIKMSGIVSTAILARLLTPEDYGLVAIGLILVGFIKIFFDLGVELSLIRDANATAEDFNTAWSMRLLQSWIIGVLILLSAPLAAWGYEDPRLEAVFYWCALAVFIKAFENIGVVELQKSMDFRTDFVFRVISKLGGVACTIALAFYYRNYLALLIGVVCQHLISVLASYYFSKMRVKFSLSGWRKLWDFSRWMLVKNIGNYVANRGDYLLIAKFVPLSSVGYYRWASELNTLVTSELMQPISRVLFPGFAQYESQPEKLLNIYRRSLNMIVSIAIPCILGLGVVAPEAIPLLLGGGDKWLPVVPLLQLITIAALFRCLHSLANNYLIVIGLVRLTAYLDTMRTIVAIALLYPSFIWGGLHGVIYLKILISFLMMVSYYYLLVKNTNLVVSEIVSDLWRPVLAGLTMVVFVFSVPFWVESSSLLIILICKLVVGGISYAATLSLLWISSGRPESFESEAVYYCGGYLKKVLNP